MRNQPNPAAKASKSGRPGRRYTRRARGNRHRHHRRWRWPPIPDSSQRHPRRPSAAAVARLRTRPATAGSGEPSSADPSFRVPRPSKLQTAPQAPRTLTPGPGCESGAGPNPSSRPFGAKQPLSARQVVGGPRFRLTAVLQLTFALRVDLSHRPPGRRWPSCSAPCTRSRLDHPAAAAAARRGAGALGAWRPPASSGTSPGTRSSPGAGEDGSPVGAAQIPAPMVERPSTTCRRGRSASAPPGGAPSHRRCSRRGCTQRSMSSAASGASM